MEIGLPIKFRPLKQLFIISTDVKILFQLVLLLFALAEGKSNEIYVIFLETSFLSYESTCFIYDMWLFSQG